MFSARKAILTDTAFLLSLCALYLHSKPSNIHRLTRHFTKRTQIEKFLTLCLSIRNEIFRANLARKTNPKRTHFETLSNPFFEHSCALLCAFETWNFAIFQLLPPLGESNESFSVAAVYDRRNETGNDRANGQTKQNCHRPKIRPENKGIKPKSNRHKPKILWHLFGGLDLLWCLDVGTWNFYHRPLHSASILFLKDFLSA
jgi:hypothetical protein